MLPIAPQASLGRRQFLIGAGATGALLVLGGCGGDGSSDQTDASTSDASTSDASPSDASTSNPPTGPATQPTLRPAGDDLALPEGFSYAVLSSSADGRMPPAPDGMAVFAMPDGTTRLVRNHERGETPGVGAPLDLAGAYDGTAPGGTTTLVLAADLRSVTAEHTSLSGTLRNCAGGATPWGSWLSCEETTLGATQGWGREHGYIFEVDAAADGPVVAEPLIAMGRFLHEAVVVDPATGILFLTEDNGYDSGLYRFTPTTPGALAAGGTLEMLAVRDQPEYDTAFAQTLVQRLPVAWVPIADPDPSTAHTDTSAVFNQGFAAGGARFKRLEGCCMSGGTLYVAATEAGDAGLGQVWAYDPVASELRLVFEAADASEVFGPDNLTPAPWMDGVVLSEDNGNGDPNRLHVLGADGKLVTFAENIADTTEFAGACFSPDGSTLFVNIFGDEATNVPGRTLAIWGPWASLV